MPERKLFIVTENHMTTHQFYVYAETSEEAQFAAQMLNPDEDAFDIDEEYVNGYAEECKDQVVGDPLLTNLVFEWEKGDQNVRKFVAKPEEN
jgi:hypothetical protein